MLDSVFTNDAVSPWWTPMSSFDTKEDQQERVNEFLNFVQYCGDEFPIFVGHSLFFKLFYSKRISKILSSYRPELAANLKRHKLSNATVLAVTVQFADTQNPSEICDAELVFGGGFHIDDRAEDHSSNSDHGTSEGAAEDIRGGTRPRARSRFGSLSALTGQFNGIKNMAASVVGKGASVVGKVFAEL